MRMGRTELIGVRVEPALRSRIQALATQGERSLSRQVYSLIKLGLTALSNRTSHARAPYALRPSQYLASARRDRR